MSARALSLIAALAVVTSTVLVCGPTANAQQEGITATVTVDGRDAAIAVSGEPIPLYPNKIADVTVDVANHGTEPIEIASIQLIGRVLGLTFFNYATGVALTVAPGATGTVQYELDLSDLERQATGLMDTELVVRDASRDTVAVVETVADIRGSLLSVYGLLGLSLLVLTALAIVNAVIAIARHKDSTNRLRRGLQLLSPGIGIGLVLVFTASVARWWVPRTEWWLLAAGITGAVFFALGYFSPTPEVAASDDDVEGDLEEAAAEPPDDNATVVLLRNGHDEQATVVLPRDA
jgi:hypothetical protein